LFFLEEGKGEDKVETIIKDDPVLQKLHSDYSKFTADDKMRDLYEARKKREYDELSRLQSARKEGMEEGLEQTAWNMLVKGYEITEIAELTGLSVEELEKLSRE
jgi:predicted transposase/invertase (TIGR01784 family)